MQSYKWSLYHYSLEDGKKIITCSPLKRITVKQSDRFYNQTLRKYLFLFCSLLFYIICTHMHYGECILQPLNTFREKIEKSKHLNICLSPVHNPTICYIVKTLTHCVFFSTLSLTTCMIPLFPCMVCLFIFIEWVYLYPGGKFVLFFFIVFI